MVTDNEKMKIHLSIADQTYAMTINRQDEEFYRKAAKDINEKLNMYRLRHPEGSLVNHLTMVAFDFAFKLTTTEYKNDTQPYLQKLQELTEELEERFREEQKEEGI